MIKTLKWIFTNSSYLPIVIAIALCSLIMEVSGDVRGTSMYYIIYAFFAIILGVTYKKADDHRKDPKRNK